MGGGGRRSWGAGTHTPHIHPPARGDDAETGAWHQRRRAGASRQVAGVFLPAGGQRMTRAGLRTVTRQTRAYFAALDRLSGTPGVFDPSRDGGVQLDAPPSPWIDLGWIGNFQRTSTAQIRALSSG